jgi:hypothetical protein
MGLLSYHIELIERLAPIVEISVCCILPSYFFGKSDGITLLLYTCSLFIHRIIFDNSHHF